MSDRSPLLDLPLLQPTQAQKHVTHNEALAQLDVLVQLCVEDFDQTQPPALPHPGSVHALGAGASGAWAGQDHRLAAFLNGGWHFISPAVGWRAFGRADGSLRLWNGSQWDSPTSQVETLPQLGIATSADATNRLAVAAPATLLSHAGQGHQLKLNKASSSDTASLLFQSNWSGHAEMGLAGDTDFALKVSPDGSTWHTALATDGLTGRVRAPNGVLLGGADAAHHLNHYESGSYEPALLDGSGNSQPLSGQSVPYVRIGDQVSYFFAFLNDLDISGLTATDDIALSLPFSNGPHAFGAVELRGGLGTPGPYHWHAQQGQARAYLRSLSTNSRLHVGDITSGITDIVGGTLTVCLAS